VVEETEVDERSLVQEEKRDELRRDVVDPTTRMGLLLRECEHTNIISSWKYTRHLPSRARTASAASTEV